MYLFTVKGEPSYQRWRPVGNWSMASREDNMWTLANCLNLPDLLPLIESRETKLRWITKSCVAMATERTLLKMSGTQYYSPCGRCFCCTTSLGSSYFSVRASAMRIPQISFTALGHHLAENTTNKTTSHALSQRCGTDKYQLSLFPTLVEGLALSWLAVLFCQHKLALSRKRSLIWESVSIEISCSQSVAFFWISDGCGRARGSEGIGKKTKQAR